MMAGAATHIVDANHGGNFTTVSAAIKAASQGDRILVRPGRYDESLVVDKPLEIIGDGHFRTVEIWGATTDHVLKFTATTGRVANVTFCQPRSQSAYGVYIPRGRLDLEGCDISSEGASCVYILRGANPLLRRNVIHDAGGYGVFVYEGGRGILEDNEIVGSSKAGVKVQEGSCPLLRRNVIRNGSNCGIWVDDLGEGTFEANVITGNASSGVVISGGGSPMVRGNRINDNGLHGVHVEEGGKGVIEDNDLTGNHKGAWEIDHRSKHDVIRTRNRE